MSSRPSPASEPPSPRAALLARLAASGPFGFGASPLGNLYAPMDDAAARAVVDAAWDRGIRYFDTAPFYGTGLSERRLGDALRGRDRDAFLLSTKAGRLLVPGGRSPGADGFHSPMPFSPVFDYSYDGVMRSFEASLHRLGLDRIDILLLHDLGRATHGSHHARHFAHAVAGGFHAMAKLRDQGLVSAIGLGVNEAGICAESMPHADFDLFLIAGRYTLLDQRAADFFAACHDRGIGILAAGVFNSGILATGADARDAQYDYAPADAHVRGRVSALERICAEFGVPLAAAALQFAAANPAVTLPLVGVRSTGELAATLGHAAAAVPAALWGRLCEEREMAHA